MTTPEQEAQAKAGLDRLASATGFQASGTVTVKASGDMVQVDAQTGKVVAADPSVPA